MSPHASTTSTLLTRRAFSPRQHNHNLITTFGIGALIGIRRVIAAADSSQEPIIGYMLSVESSDDAFFRMTVNEVPRTTTSFERRICSIWANISALEFMIADSCSNLPSSIASLTVFLISRQSTMVPHRWPCRRLLKSSS
ncbi:hypothetical protein A1O1_05648 [Capronia coronata CBS 617.96]|uniref:Uncharacterized protein n=1 Tax=Capronia coronata CBS 617.96 TaxID=1182541 RepID=W9YHH2_9EURO|nr:uncharacterized protein A1O1_05648 [Capronia coronata CBS 617.96]EXJ88716.1 hypothetical protein A1O1_05648 [Capronia coronata CBS 617.96]